jgi:CheY-like chemotaxis protein
LGKTILVVDDDAGVQASLGEILEAFGYRTLIAGDGLEAIERLAEGLPALILLDLMMPRMDGFAFAEELGRRGLRPALPIIVLTADGRAEQKAGRVGADDYLAKPFDLDELLEKVETLAGA